MEATTLQEIPYKGFLPHRPGTIAFAMREQLCVFSGLTKEATSTVNAAENVIQALMEHHGWNRDDVKDITFSDLHTHRAYAYTEGMYRYEVLDVGYLDNGTPLVHCWDTQDPPTWVIETFSSLIGE